MEKRGSLGKLLVLLLLTAACSGPEPSSSSSREPILVDDQESAPRGAPDQSEMRRPRMSDRIRGAAEMRPTILGFELNDVDVAEAEDGQGQIVAARNPLAVDIRAESWPGRALDPVLSIGQSLQLRHYRHPGPGLLRFVIADADLLPQGAVVTLQYGDDVSSRVEITPSLQVPR